MFADPLSPPHSISDCLVFVQASIYIPAVGKVTILMLLRNL